MFDYEIVEPCPHCGHENVFTNWSIKEDGWIIHCLKCGEKIFLCDECLHSEDNEAMDCDWCDGTCFRGTTKIKENTI